MMEFHHDMRKPHYFIFFLLVLFGKLSFAGGSVQSLFHHKDQVHVSHHSEVANYFPAAVLEQPVEMEDDNLEKLKKHFPSFTDTPRIFICGILPAGLFHQPFDDPAIGQQPADLVILHCRILI